MYSHYLEHVHTLTEAEAYTIRLEIVCPFVSTRYRRGPFGQSLIPVESVPKTRHKKP